MSNVFLGSSHFPFKVHVILERGYDCIQWCGPNCFRLVDTKAFVADVLPKFFKHEKLSSFTRQLNIYGFHKIREGPLKGAYTHEDFMRGDLERVSSIPRTKRSGPRAVMKVRESRNASVIYSSMMVRKDNHSPVDDDISSCSSNSDYSSDSSGSCTPSLQTEPISNACVPVVKATSKRKRENNTTSSLFAILEKTRFSYKERSYVELKAETELVAKRMRLNSQNNANSEVEDAIALSPSPKFQSDFALDDFDFPTLPRSVSQHAVDNSQNYTNSIKYAHDVDELAAEVLSNPDDNEPVLDVLDQICHEDPEFTLFNENEANIFHVAPEFAIDCW